MSPSIDTPKEGVSYHPETKLAILINEGLKKKGLTINKLSEISGIALKHLEHMSSGNIEKFPAAPYLRSYLIVIGRILDFDGQAVWHRLRIDELAVSANQERGPRKIYLSSKTKILWLGGVALVFGLYLLFRIPYIIGQPSLEIGFPTAEVTTVDLSPVTVIGKIKNGDEFFINGERLPLGADGVWQKEIPLQPGMNTIELIGKKFLGQEVKVLKQIIYNPSTVLVGNPTSSLERAESSTETTASTTAESQE